MINDVTTAGSVGSETPKQPSAPKSKKPRVRGFLYQIEYHPNPDCITIHTKNVVPEIDDSTLGLRYAIDNEGKRRGLGGTRKKVHPFYKDLAKVRGLHSADERDRFSLHCVKANGLFSWETMLPGILKAIQVHLAKKRTMVEVLPRIQPSPEDRRGGGSFFV